MADVKITCQCSKGHCEFHIDDEADVYPDDFIHEFNLNGCPGKVDRCHVINCDEPSWKYDSKGVRIHEDDEEGEEDDEF